MSTRTRHDDRANALVFIAGVALCCIGVALTSTVWVGVAVGGGLLVADAWIGRFR